MPSIQATPQNPYLDKASKGLRWARDTLDHVELGFPPLTESRLKLGDALIGKAPEEVNEWSYGNSPLRVPEMTRVPQLKQGRADGVISTAFLPAAEAVGVANLVGRGVAAGSRGVMNAAASVGQDASRREFMKKGSALAGGAVAAAAAPLALRTIEHTLAGDGARIAGKAAAKAAVRRGTAHEFLALHEMRTKERYAALDAMHTPEFRQRRAQARREDFDEGEHVDYEGHDYMGTQEQAVIDELETAQDLVMKQHDDIWQKSRSSPEFEGQQFMSEQEIRDGAYAAFPNPPPSSSGEAWDKVNQSREAWEAPHRERMGIPVEPFRRSKTGYGRN